jgi:hypothetical protein
MPSVYGETPIGLTSQILNLAAILTRRGALKVPRYQRPYTWTEREVRRLIQDLRAAWQRPASFYFIGQIVLVRNDYDEYEISDGQQRLATLSMIIAYVRDRLPDRTQHFQGLLMDEGGQRPRLLLRDEDAGFYRGYVQEPGHMAELALLDEMGSDSKDAMIVAARTIAAELREMLDRDLEALMSYVVRSSTFNVVDAAERGCAATVYNTVNDRGLELSAADNIKCDLLENSRLKSEEANAAARKWEELEDVLGRARFAKLLNMMPFLLTGEHFISPGDLAAFREQVEKAGGVRVFLFDKLPRYAAALRDILDGAVDVGAASADVNRRLALMKQLGEWHWAPAALAFLADHRHPDRAEAFFQALDCFSFACAIGGDIIDNKVRARRFADAARYAGDLKKAISTQVLGLSNKEHVRMMERLHRSNRRDLQRRLLLWRIEAAMPNGSILGEEDDTNVEHILPKSGEHDYWAARFPDKKLREDMTHMLGNFTLTTFKQNEACDRKPYPEKLKIYFETKGAPIHALTRQIRDIKEWSVDIIGERQEEMVYRLCLDWGLAFKPE